MFRRKFLKSITLLGIRGRNGENKRRIGHCLQCVGSVALQNILHHNSRSYSQTTYEQCTKTIDPHIFVKNELRDINNAIINLLTKACQLSGPSPHYKYIRPKQILFLVNGFVEKWELNTPLEPLKTITQYYFDSKGKLFRPAVILLMATVCNKHLYENPESLLSNAQKTIARVAEMIHTASLVHDDIIDLADSRRGKPATHHIWGEKEAVLAGNYIMSRATIALARLGNTEVIQLLARVLDDLVRGEFMQMGSREDPNERFTHYLDKTFKKTASLLAYTCRSVALLANGSKELQDLAFQYGKNLGMAFQLVDDVLDFNSTQEVLGKPAAADLRLGLATGPVLFASEEFPEITAFIMRRFKGENDVEETYELVRQSTGIERTMSLARQHSREATRQLMKLQQSPERDALVELTENLLKRER